jgi:small subunit ribosomal protein S21
MKRHRKKLKPYNLEIIVRNPEDTERMIKKFNRKVKKMGILEEVREKRYYTKPSAKRRRKKIDAQRRQRKNKQ